MIGRLDSTVVLRRRETDWVTSYRKSESESESEPEPEFVSEAVSTKGGATFREGRCFLFLSIFVTTPSSFESSEVECSTVLWMCGRRPRGARYVMLSLPIT